jgi:DNA invertase Pin-like site-specific DNA recombinase
MKTKNTISASEQFKKDIMASMHTYYRQTLSENAKRAWQRRKGKLSTLGKVAL